LGRFAELIDATQQLARAIEESTRVSERLREEIARLGRRHSGRNARRARRAERIDAAMAAPLRLLRPK